MKRILAMAIFFPALVAWVFFAPLFRLANALTDRIGINQGYSLWFWLGVEAKEHKRFYSVYEVYDE